MQIVRLGLALAGLALGAPALAAQQPVSPHMPQRPHSGMMMDSAAMAGHMRMSDSLDARLDTLVGRMNKATGDRKMAAMADVINELVAQRRAMTAGMHRMMQSRDSMMRMRGPKGRDSTSAGPPAHSEHHPS